MNLQFGQKTNLAKKTRTIAAENAITNSLLHAWTAPNANGYPVSGYTIERSTDAGVTWSVLAADTQNTNVTYTDINLTVSQTYYYKISAINQVGTGLASADANAQAGDCGRGVPFQRIFAVGINAVTRGMEKQSIDVAAVCKVCSYFQVIGFLH